MFNNIALDVFIGLVFIFLLYSMLATVIHEIIAQMFDMRPRMLLKGLSRMLEDRAPAPGENNTAVGLWHDTGEALSRFAQPFKDRSFVKKFYDHPTIKYLAESRSSSKPSYISAHNFSQTLIHLLRGSDYTGQGSQMEAIRKYLFETAPDERMIPAETLKHLQQLYLDAQEDIDRFRSKLEHWFEETMQRVSGWYKRQTQWVLFIIGFGLAAIFNGNVLDMYKILAKDKKTRDQMVQLAEGYSKYTPYIDSLKKKNAAAKTDTIKAGQGAARSTDTVFVVVDTLLNKEYTRLKTDLQEAQGVMGIGRPTQGSPARNFFGWLLMALAVMLGAPFWFDLLSKLIQLRSSGPKPAAAQPGTGTAPTSPSSNPLQRVG